MTKPRLTVADAFTELKDEVDLAWVAGKSGGDRVLTREPGSGPRPRLLGPLNFNSANRIQLLGRSEVRQFASTDELLGDRFEYSLRNSVELFVVTDGLGPPASIIALADDAGIPLFCSRMPYSELQKTMRHLLTQRLADRQIIHGVMMDVHGTGVLITGDASVGKSELALELISRGHILVADDAPEFTRIAPGTLESRCPPLLQDFLEVRGLGVLNIARMYGEAHTRVRKILRFIVRLQIVDGVDPVFRDVFGERIGEPEAERMILGVAIPERTIPVAPGRNLAVLVEAAVRDYILLANGYSASRDLVEKQAEAMQQSQGKQADQD